MNKLHPIMLVIVITLGIFIGLSTNNETLTKESTNTTEQSKDETSENKQKISYQIVTSSCLNGGI